MQPLLQPLLDEVSVYFGGGESARRLLDQVKSARILTYYQCFSVSHALRCAYEIYQACDVQLWCRCGAEEVF